MPEHVEVEQLKARHIKLASKKGKIDVHASDKTLGVWISNGKQNATAYIDGQSGVTLCFYPHMNGFPFAVSSQGLQLPTRSTKESPTIITWEKLENLLRMLN